MSREEGMDIRNVEIAREMKQDGIDIEIIVRYTGLSIEAIDAL
jgi:hypothetical protein